VGIYLCEDAENNGRLPRPNGLAMTGMTNVIPRSVATWGSTLEKEKKEERDETMCIHTD
jgi:hypothetical protein